MFRRQVSLLCIAALCGLALALAGCGGGGSKSSSPPKTTTTAETTTTATTTTETTTAATSTTPSKTAFASTENCRQLANVGAKLSSALSGTGGSDIQKAAKAFHEYADQAPSEIRSDFQTIADAYTKIADALKGVNLQSGQTPSAAALAKLQKLSTEINQTKLTKASQNIAAWAQKNCHA